MNKTIALKILGIKPESSGLEIKRAFRRKARKSHPDINRAEGAGEDFREVCEAYHFLFTDLRRTQYLQETKPKKREESESLVPGSEETLQEFLKRTEREIRLEHAKREARIEREHAEREARIEREHAEREARIEREHAEREARVNSEHLSVGSEYKC